MKRMGRKRKGGNLFFFNDYWICFLARCHNLLFQPAEPKFNLKHPLFRPPNYTAHYKQRQIWYIYLRKRESQSKRMIGKDIFIKECFSNGSKGNEEHWEERESDIRLSFHWHPIIFFVRFSDIFKILIFCIF